MTIHSTVSNIPVSADQIVAFLKIPVNILKILPGDRIENTASDELGCSFRIKGLADISIELDSADVKKVAYRSKGDKPFSFVLTFNIEEAGSNTNLNIDLDADVNAFMGAMIKAPLENFLNELVKKLSEHFES
ncbi:MAG: hypothetical protein Kow0075_12500 [Salibacteraceae bacterium]